MSKNKYSPTLDTLQEFLEKARRRLSDEDADVWENYDNEKMGLEGDLDNEEDEDKNDAAAQWLKRNDPKLKGGSVDNEDEHQDDDDYGSDDNYGLDAIEQEMRLKSKVAAKMKKQKGQKEKPKAKQEEPVSTASTASATPKQVSPVVRRKVEPAKPTPAAPPVEEKKAGPVVERRAAPVVPTSASAPTPAPTPTSATPAPQQTAPAPKRYQVRSARNQSSAPKYGDPAVGNDPLQPTREELNELREYTLPWERQLRDRERLEARPEVNPHKYYQGHTLEAHNLSHASRDQAFQEFVNSPEYQNADPITQMDMEADFDKKWHAENPDHLASALLAHQEAHKKGMKGFERFEREKDNKIQNIASGGAQPGAYSIEEGLQHAGLGREGEDDTTPGGITQDRAAAFAGGNKEFMQQFMQSYNRRTKKFDSEANPDEFSDETRADINQVLGSHPALKDPAKKAKVDAFVERYYPMIERAGHRVLQKLGLQDRANSGSLDRGMLNFAGMHAVFQAINDYDHDHHSGASFKTHLNRKLHGLMQTALAAQDEIPQELRTQAKKFDKRLRASNAAPVTHTDKFGNTRTIAPPSSPITPEPAPTQTPTPAPVAKPVAPVVRRSSQEIAAGHGPDVQDRLKRVTAAKQPLVQRGTMAPKKNFTVTNLEDDEGGEY